MRPAQIAARRSPLAARALLEVLQIDAPLSGKVRGSRHAAGDPAVAAQALHTVRRPGPRAERPVTGWHKHDRDSCLHDARGAPRVTHCKLAAMGSQLSLRKLVAAMHVEGNQARVQLAFRYKMPVVPIDRLAPSQARIRCAAIPS